MAYATKNRGLIILLVAGIAYAAVVLSVGAYRARLDQSSTSDFDDFWLTADHFVRSGEIVEDYGVHNYPPFFVLCFVPLSILPLKVASVVFNLGSLGGFVLCVRLVDRWLVGDFARASEEGPETSQVDAPVQTAEGCDWPKLVSPPSPFLRIAAPIGMTLPYLTGCLVLGQMAIWTLLMLVLAWDGVERGRNGRSGFWLALAISTKVYPAIFLLYFALKRQWRVCAYGLAWTIVFNMAIPVLVLGTRETAHQYARFWEGTVRGHSSLNLAVINSDKMSYTNQSTAILVHRLTQPTDSGVDDQEGSPQFVNLFDWRERDVSLAGVSLARAQWLWLAFAAVTVGMSVWVCRHPAKRLNLMRRRIEFAVFVPLSLLLSPIVWSFYYALAYLPLALMAWTGLAKWRSGRRFSPELGVTVFWWGGAVAIAIPIVRMCGYHAAGCGALWLASLWVAHQSGVEMKTATSRGKP